MGMRLGTGREKPRRGSGKNAAIYAKFCHAIRYFCSGAGGTAAVAGVSQARNPNAVMRDANSIEDFIMFPLRVDNS